MAVDDVIKIYISVLVFFTASLFSYNNTLGLSVCDFGKKDNFMSHSLAEKRDLFLC